MIRIFASATMGEAFGRLAHFLEPIIHIGKIVLIMLVSVVIFHVAYRTIKEQTQEREKEHNYKYISSSNSDTKSRLENLMIREKDKV